MIRRFMVDPLVERVHPNAIVRMVRVWKKTGVLMHTAVGQARAPARALHASLAFDLDGDSGEEVNHGHLFARSPLLQLLAMSQGQPMGIGPGIDCQVLTGFQDLHHEMPAIQRA
jgi:hypothetical protein